MISTEVHVCGRWEHSMASLSIWNPSMDPFHGGLTLLSYIDETNKRLSESPTSASDSKVFHNNQLNGTEVQSNYEASHSISMSKASANAPPSPESPWLISPRRTPSPSLFYSCVASLHILDGHVFSLGITKGMVFTSSESRRIRVWNKNELSETSSIKTKSGEIRSILVHGHSIFSAHRDYKIRIWNFSCSSSFNAKKVFTIPKKNTLFPLLTNSEQSTHKDRISCLAYYHAEKLLYTGSWDKTVRVWRINDRSCQDMIFAHEDKINSIVINQEDGTVFTGSSDTSIKIWRRVCGETFHNLIMTLKYLHCPVNTLALSSVSFTNKPSVLYSGSSDGLISIWIKEKNSTRFGHGRVLQGHTFAVLCLTTIGNLVFSGSEDTTIRVCKRVSDSWVHECLAVLEGHGGPVKCMAACLDTEEVVKGFLLCSGGLDSLKVWKIKMPPEDNGKCYDDINDDLPGRASVHLW